VERVDTPAAVRCPKTKKNRFAVPSVDGEGAAGTVRVRYTVHAHELTVRTSHLDDTHAYLNHACVLLWPVGSEQVPATIEVVLPAGWRHACALPTIAENSDAACSRVTMRADDLAAAVDAPFLGGRFAEQTITVHGVRHRILLDGLGDVQPPATLAADFTAIVEAAAEVFGGRLPYTEYLFQCLFTDDGHGGLEHANSTTLLMSRTALHDRKGYQEFLSLAAHELFHAWNVKRMRPREFWSYDYENENYTRLLWLMEGWTAYFDDLLTLRAGLCTREEYLDAVAGNLDRMYAAPGRFAQSLEESSYDAWIRLYRPDANTRNSSQNYYGNGAVAAMCLDLHLRRASSGLCSLESVIRSLYERTFGSDRGYDRSDVDAVLRQAGGESAVALLRNLVDGPLDPPVAELLAAVGLQLKYEGAGAPFLGIGFEPGGTTIASVQRDSPSFTAGLAPGDEILALGNLRVNGGNWRKIVAAVLRIGQPAEVLRTRRGVVGTVTLVPAPARGTPRISVAATEDETTRNVRDGWLRTKPPTAPNTTAPSTATRGTTPPGN
jgi:predicted metalloprotease with PDZ domain